jgi:hydrogenase expression/formation protein HypE
MLQACPDIHATRDPTRGGLSSTLNEMAEASKVGVRLDQSLLPMKPEVKVACEMLGLDPLYVANEGKMIAAVPGGSADAVLAAMRNHPLGQNAAVIGQVTDDHPGMVLLKALAGGERVVTMIAGEQLPQIC